MKKYKISVPFYGYDHHPMYSIKSPISVIFTDLATAQKLVKRIQKVLDVREKASSPYPGRMLHESEETYCTAIYEQFGLSHGDGFFNGKPVLTEVIETVIN